MSIRKIIKAGDKFGRLSVIREIEPKAPNSRGRRLRRVLTVCNCGNEKIALLVNLTGGRTKSCGCFLSENRLGKRGPHIRRSTKIICANEAPHAASGINVKHYNRSRPMAMDTNLQSFPLFDIYEAMKTSAKKDRKALLDYAIDFYGVSCVSKFFERCERAA